MVTVAVAAETAGGASMKALVVEDEDGLREDLSRRLRDDGWTVESTGDGEEGLYFGREFPFDVAIIDLGLPGLSGLKLIERIRAENVGFPVLILTARDRWQDKVEGLRIGADDYLTKPFHMEELIARINALVRRSAGWSSPVLESGPIQLDTAAQEVRLGGEPVELTGFEYKVLEYLMLHAGEVISKADLTEHLYSQDFERDSNVIEVFIGRLRRKLDPDGNRNPIQTLRGRGYRFTLERNEA
jgi:two-component system response regulator PhoP